MYLASLNSRSPSRPRTHYALPTTRSTPTPASTPCRRTRSFRTYARVRAEHTATSLSARTLRDALDAVAMRALPEELWLTMGRTVFDVADRTMTTRFYLGAGEYGQARYSAEVTFEATR